MAFLCLFALKREDGNSCWNRGLLRVLRSPSESDRPAALSVDDETDILAVPFVAVEALDPLRVAKTRFMRVLDG